MSEKQAKTIVDHNEIKTWVEERDGKPAKVKESGEKGSGILRIDYPGYSGEDTLEQISWEEWFQIFDDNELAFLCQEKTADGSESRFSKLVSRQ